MSATSQLLQLHLYEHQCEDDGEKDGIKKTSTGDRSTVNNGRWERSVYGRSVLIWALWYHKAESPSRMKSQHKQLVNKTLALIAYTEVYQVGSNNTRDRIPVGTIFIW